MPPRTLHFDPASSDGADAVVGAHAPPRRSALRSVPPGRAGLDSVERLLQRAEAPDGGPLRRLRQLAAASAGLDRYFQLDGARLRKRSSRSGDPVRRRVLELIAREETLFHDQLVPELDQLGVRLTTLDRLDPEARVQAEREFDERIFPLLTPLVLGPAHPVPFVRDLALHVAALVRHEDGDVLTFTRVEIPRFLDRFLAFADPAGRTVHVVAAEELIATHAQRLIPDTEIASRGVFRVTRAAAGGAAGGDPARGEPVRLECEADLSPEARDVLLDVLGIDARDAYPRRSPLALRDVDQLRDLSGRVSAA